jgi:hypothetical protein
MVDPTYVKAFFFTKAKSLLKFGGLTTECAQTKGKIRNPENFGPGGRKSGIKYAIFFNILAPMDKTRNIVYKEALKA